MHKIEAVSKVNNNTIVVIHAVGPVNVHPWVAFANVTAIVVAGLPGEQTGPALFDVLYGDVKCVSSLLSAGEGFSWTSQPLREIAVHHCKQRLRLPRSGLVVSRPGLCPSRTLCSR